MDKIKIEDTDIFLDDQGNGQGKIIIANTYGYNFSFFWGAMGGSLPDFLLRINESYFVGKLLDGDDNGVLDAKKSVTAVRKYLREECHSDLPWYKYPTAQKSLREELKKLEQCERDDEFVDGIYALPKNVDYSDLDWRDERELRQILEGICQTEPWTFIVKGPSRKALFLKRLFPKLQKAIKENNLKPMTV
jgi:hypothetical protein